MPRSKVIKVQQFDKNIPIEFYTIEDNKNLFDFNYHYQYNFYQIFWFTSTDNSHQQIDFESYPISAQQVWVIYPGQVHYFDPTGITGYYLAIDKDYFHRIMQSESLENTTRFTPPLWFEMAIDKVQLYMSMVYLFEQEWNNQKRTALLEKYLVIYLTHIQDLKELSTHNALSDKRIYQLLELIEQNYTSHENNVFYAHHIALSVKRMNELLVKATQATLNQHIHQRLLLEAKRLIGYSELNIQEIATELGFNEVNYFNRFFKKHTDLTPIEFRTNVKKVQELRQL